jgi:hypothetical protein
MRNSLYKRVLIIIVVLIGLTGCKKFLQEQVYTEYDPTVLLQDQTGVDALLTGAYSRSRIVGYDSRNYTYIMNEFTTDIALESGGGLEATVVPYMNFSWGTNDGYLNTHWSKMYSAIGSANSVLSVTSGLKDLSEEKLNTIRGEARFIRAVSYYFLYNIFGPTPIIEVPDNATPDQLEALSQTPRASKADFLKYMIDDLNFAANNLPVVENPIGRATKGAALAVLTKLYLHEKDWDNVIATADKVIGLNNYTLYSDYGAMFSVAGEANKEYIYRASCIARDGFHNNYIPHAFPPNYPIQSNWANFGAQFRTYTSFYKTFEVNDTRRNVFITEYTDISGNKVQLLQNPVSGAALDNARSFKYVPDPAAVGEANGNDIVYIRYADILLSKAEALNEKTGPSTDAIGLINQVRSRAKASNWNVASFASKDVLRDSILAERGREFFSEGLRREDLIRHGKFISGAIARGKAAKSYQVLFPIPQQQRDANKNLEQNEGYN